MEQKTEASQAVDPDMLDAVTSKVAEFYPQSLPRDMEKNHRLARAILRTVNRAALKAQPAPTEAQGEPVAYRHHLPKGEVFGDGKPTQLLDNFDDAWEAQTVHGGIIEALHGAATTPTEAAQGEPTAEQYDEMLRALCCNYGVGGYNSDGLIDPKVADSKLRFALDEQLRVGGELALKKAQGALSANSNLTTSGVTCQPVAAQGDALRDIGGQMANVMFNLKQEGGPNAVIYSDLQAKWDAAVRAQLSGNSGELQPSGNTGELAHGEGRKPNPNRTLDTSTVHDDELACTSCRLTMGQARSLAAQGEDSARLDGERYQWIRAAEWSDIESIFWSHAVQSGSSPEACQAELDAAIDRARASAETGGVKS